MNDKEYLEKFRAKVLNLRVPLSGTLEVTSRCNLKCVHCYLGPQEEQHKHREREMSTEKVKHTLDEIVEAGCLNLLITGGDPMMRKDFAEIYRYAKESGLLVTIFCDGILVTDKIIELFQELPPAGVEVSIYGATAETYEAVTRVKGSYPLAIAGIERLLAAGIRTTLKTVLMEPNKHEYTQMEQMAKHWGITWRFDSAIFPCLPNGDKKPIDLRVSPEEAVHREMSDPARVAAWREYYDRRKDMPKSDKLYKCGAGTTGFYVDPFANVSPCLMTTNYKYSLNDASFFDRWQNDVGELRERTGRAEHECTTCSAQAACTGCSAFFQLEMGAEDVKSPYVCETTRLRLKVITDNEMPVLSAK